MNLIRIKLLTRIDAAPISSKLLKLQARRKPNTESNQESGAIILLALFFLIALFLVLGMVLDAGNLYQTQLRLQKAVDAGALGGMASTVIQSEELRGLAEPARKQFVETRAQAIVLQNLTRDGVTVVTSDIIANYRAPSLDGSGSPVNGKLSVSVQVDLPLWLLNRLPLTDWGMPGISSNSRLSANATTDRPPANIALVLDVSNSMRCLSINDVDNCECLTPARVQGKTCEQLAITQGVPQRIDRLKSAATEFVRRFDATFDRLAIIPFNIAGNTSMKIDPTPTIDNVNYAIRFRPYSGDGVQVQSGFDFDENPTTDDLVSLSIAGLTPRSNTNLSDALLRAYQEADRVKLFNNEQVLYLLFSDGAPTAGRFLFTDRAVAGKPLPRRAKPDWLADFDYTVYSLYWDPVLPDDPRIPPAAKNLLYAGPSPLIFTGDIKINQADVAPVPSSVPACSQAALEPLAFRKVFERCLFSFESKTPDRPGGGRTFGASYLVSNFLSLEAPLTADKILDLIQNGNTAGLRFWREMFFNAAIEIADFLRQNKGVVYTIGLGQESIPQNDAYQFAEKFMEGQAEITQASLERKDIALSRMANAWDHAVTGRQLEGLNPYPDFPYQEHKSYQTLRDTPGVNQGLYFPTVSSSELSAVFERAALEALLRLIE